MNLAILGKSAHTVDGRNLAPLGVPNLRQVQEQWDEARFRTSPIKIAALESAASHVSHPRNGFDSIVL